ncbi:MAG TPA: aminopeptidase N [Methylococcaceae bacterium]|nr:aminopeptidase N [Methylococcaceae bacterium]
MYDNSPKTIFLKDYLPPAYLIQTVDLNFILDATETRVISTLKVEANPAHKAGSPLVLSGEQLCLKSVALNGQVLTAADYVLDDEALTLSALPRDGVFELIIETTLNPSVNTALEGLYMSNGLFCTQCEAEGFRKITYFLDRPDVMSCYTTTIIGDKTLYPVLLSNGNQVAHGELSDGRHWVTWEDPFPKPCYLFALVAGPLVNIEDRFTTMTGREIALQVFVEPNDLDKCGHAMRSLKHAMTWDERVYGREYDLDLYMIVAVSHFNMGAMENKGLNVFNTKFVLARPDTATDTDYEHIEGVIGHEYFHNWTGNRVTCRDWFQLSLKEGLTVFRDQEFTADHTSKAVKRIEDVNMLRTRQFAEDAGPLAHPIRPDSYIEINNFYTLTIYEKGAEVVRMLHTLVGAEGFRLGTDLYFQRHDGQAVTCYDFVKAMEDANRVDLSQFNLWYQQAGTPEVRVTVDYQQDAQKLLLTCHQSCRETPGYENKLPLHIPIRFGMLGSEGQVLELQQAGATEAHHEIVLALTEVTQTFEFIGVKHLPALSLLRGFSAPVKLIIDQDLEQLAFLSSYDVDTFNRWEAGQKLACSLILDLVQDYCAGRPLVLNKILIEVYDNILSQPWDDLSYLTLLLTLPSEIYLHEQVEVINVEAIHAARQFVKITLAEQLHEKFEQLYIDHHIDESGQFNSGAIGRRRVKNTALAYLSIVEGETSYQRSEAQFKAAKNMTDQLAALQAIVNSQHHARAQLLAQFYTQWHGDALVIDKWFSLQATSYLPEAFDVVRTLTGHTAFDIKNPNRVRALVGAFSQANPLHFHRADGAGYLFLADQIVKLNNINPQVAARMVVPLTHWQRFDVARQQQMKGQLERIMVTPGICKDVYEIVSKSLKGAGDD